jgi:formate dehydrogenase subunit gamma
LTKSAQFAHSSDAGKVPVPTLGHADLARIDELIAQYRDEPGGLLPLLHAVQEALGFVPAEAVGPMARALNLSRAEVHGVITYYHFFRSEKPGRRIVQVCRAESCKAVGADALLAHAEKKLGCRLHGGNHATRQDGAVTLEPVYCLGLCAMSPAIMIDEKPYARMSLAKFDELAEKLEIAA